MMIRGSLVKSKTNTQAHKKSPLQKGDFFNIHLVVIESKRLYQSAFSSSTLSIISCGIASPCLTKMMQISESKNATGQ